MLTKVTTRLPDTVAVGPVDYSVREDLHAIAESRLNASDHRWAQTNRFTTEITLDPSMSAARKRETLMHECVHALLYEWNVDLGDLKEEPLVESLGDAFLSLIRQNPELIAYVSAK